MRLPYRAAVVLTALTVASVVLPAQMASATTTARPQAVATQQIDRPTTNDIRIHYGWGIYVSGMGYEWNAVGAALVGAGAATVTAGCLLTGKRLPPRVRNVIRWICGYLGAPAAAAILALVRRTFTHGRFYNGRCYRYNFIRPGNGFDWVPIRHNCRP